LQAISERTNPAESVGSLIESSAPPMQAESSQHKNFGQPVVSASSVPQEADDLPITPAQAAARFNILEYMLRNACADGQLEHLRVVNSLWLAAAAVAKFVRSCRAKKGRDSEQ